MKTLVALILIVAGTGLSLYAQDGGRAYISDEKLCICEPYEMPKADKVGPLHNQPLIPMPQFVTNFIDPVLLSISEALLPVKYDYRPYLPVNGEKRNIKANMPTKKER